MADNNLDDIILRVLSGTFTSADFEHLIDWCGESEENLAHFRQVKKLWNHSAGARFTSEEVERSLAQLKIEAARITQHSARRRRRLWLGTASAAVMAVAAVVISSVQPPDTPLLLAVEFPAYPAAEGISLTLEDGTVVDIESASVGLADDAVSRRVGELALNVESVDYSSVTAEQPEIKMNTLQVGRGKRYMATLSDGTRVWLNSGSSLTYPVKLQGGQRDVTMTGECYFEVARDEKRPFLVHAGGLTVEVLGTAFNMTAYENEGVYSITLASGKVRAVAPSGALMMEPGMRTELDMASGAISSSTVSAADYSGWVNGRYTLRDETFARILSKLELWYDVRIVNESGVDPGMLFNGDFDNMDIESAIRSLCVNTSTDYEYDRQTRIFRILK